MAKTAKTKKNKEQEPNKDSGMLMLNQIKLAFSTTTLMAMLQGKWGDLFSAIIVATSEYIIEEAGRNKETPEKFFDYFTSRLKECVAMTLEDMDKIEQATDKDSN